MLSASAARHAMARVQHQLAPALLDQVVEPTLDGAEGLVSRHPTGWRQHDHVSNDTLFKLHQTTLGPES